MMFSDGHNHTILSRIQCTANVRYMGYGIVYKTLRDIDNRLVHAFPTTFQKPLEHDKLCCEFERLVQDLSQEPKTKKESMTTSE